MSEIDDVEEIIGYRFKDEAILTEALTHASSADHRLDSNERMEFLGDAILGFVISQYLYEQFPEYEEGELTKIKSAVVSRKTCAIVSEEIGLDTLLNLGKGMSGRAKLPGSIAAAVLESIICAIYMDGGIRQARKFILKNMKNYVHRLDASEHQHNFKSVLQQHAQKHMPMNPSYVLLDEKGPDHSKCFEVCVEIDGERFSSAWANSKKEAEQKAALLALQELGLATDGEADDVVITELK